MSLKSSTPILQLLRDRILDLLPFWHNLVWFRLLGEDNYALAEALNYRIEVYLDILYFGGFISSDGKVLIEKLSKKIGVIIDVNTY